MAVHKMPIYVSLGRNSPTAYGGKANKPRVITASENKPTNRAENVLAILKFELEIDDEVLDPIMDTGITVKITPPPAPSKAPPTKTVVKGIVAELHQIEDDVESLLQK